MSGGQALFESRLADRVARLRQELFDEDVPILDDDALPEGLSAEQMDGFRERILEETVYARYVPIHEGLRPPYGCLIVPDIAPVAQALETFRPAEVGTTTSPGTAGPWVELHAIRPLVDGQSTILVRDLPGAGGLATLDLSEELGAVDATRTHHGITVQRLPNGRIRVVTRRHIAISDGHDWSVRPHAGAVVNPLTSELALDGNRVARMREIGALLEFCFHSLSPAGIGATLVVALDGTAQDLESGVSDAGTRPAVSLNVFDRSDQTLLRNTLAAVDGACLVDPDGSLQRYQTKLASSQQTAARISEHGGTRHTSAKRFSFEHPDALVVVVSADGPVTLFCAGVVVASLPQPDSSGSWILTADPDVRKRAQQRERQDECSACQSDLTTRLTVDPESATVTTLRCVVCGTEAAQVAGVLESVTRVKRPWEKRRKP